MSVKNIFSASKDLSIERKKALREFTKSVSINFKNLELLEQAFHHRSFSNENGINRTKNNERLEFLGDSVLGMVTASFLYENLPNDVEGTLAKIKATVVSEKTLEMVALDIGIDKMLILGHGEEVSGGRKKPAILADCVEAVIGAYYIDSGYENAKAFVLSFIIPQIQNVLQDKGEKDYKTLLQEIYQKKYKKCPEYELVKVSGPDHDQTFYVSVHLQGISYGPCSGKNKKDAEQSAAKLAYEELY